MSNAAHSPLLMITSNAQKVPVVAIDARLVASRATGDATYWTGLLTGLSQLSEQVKVVAFTDRAIPELAAFRGVEVVVLRGSPSRFWSLVRFPMAARRLGAILHTQYNVSPLARRAVTTVHDVSFFVGPEWFPAKDRVLLQRFVPKSCARAKAVITVSETSKREIEQFIPAARGKVHAIHNGPNLLLKPPDNPEALRTTAKIPGQYLLTVGTRWPRKNMRLAVEAAAGHGLPLVITGKPGWGEEPGGTKTITTGYVDEPTLAALYQGASIYLAPSLHEGFGLPLLEAWGFDCPVICGPGGALPEVAGDAALVLPDYEVATWHQGIASLLADSGKVETLRARGRERLRLFSWDKAARETLAVYQAIA